MAIAPKSHQDSVIAPQWLRHIAIALIAVVPKSRRAPVVAALAVAPIAVAPQPLCSIAAAPKRHQAPAVEPIAISPIAIVP